MADFEAGRSNRGTTFPDEAIAKKTRENSQVGFYSYPNDLGTHSFIMNFVKFKMGYQSSPKDDIIASIVASINDIDSDVGALTSISSEVRDSNIVSTINALNTKVNNRNRFVEFFTDSAAGGDSAGSRIVADSANDFVKFSGGTNLEVVVEDSDNARTIKVNHTSVGASSVDNSGNTFIQDLTIDANGHVTGTTSAAATTGWTRRATASSARPSTATPRCTRRCRSARPS